MIALEALTWPALLTDTTTVVPVVRWHFGSGTSDVYEYTAPRVVSFSSVSSGLGPFLGGFRSSPVSVMLDNTDRLFSPLSAASTIANTPDADIYRTRVELLLRVKRLDRTTEDIPIYTGWTRYLRLRGDLVELRIDDMATTLLSIPLGEDVTIGHANTSCTSLIGVLVADYTAFGAGDIDTTSRDRVNTITGGTQWPITGRIPQQTSVGDAVNALARCVMATVAPTPAGLLYFHHEFPATSGNQVQTTATLQHVFDESNSWGFQYTRGMDNFVSEVIVSYRGVSAAYRDSSQEAKLGRNPVRIDLPFLAFWRQARWCARFLYEIFGGFRDYIGLTTGALGIPVELNDRIRVVDPGNEEELTVRVMSKSFDGQSVTLEGMVLGHETTVVDGTFATWDVSAWGATVL